MSPSPAPSIAPTETNSTTPAKRKPKLSRSVSPALCRNTNDGKSHRSPSSTFCKQRNSCVDSHVSATLGSGLGSPALSVPQRCGTSNRPSLRQGLPSVTARAGSRVLSSTGSGGAGSNLTTSGHVTPTQLDRVRSSHPSTAAKLPLNCSRKNRSSAQMQTSSPSLPTDSPQASLDTSMLTTSLQLDAVAVSPNNLKVPRPLSRRGR